MLYALAQGRTLDEFLSVISRGRMVYAPQSGGNGSYHLVRDSAWRTGRHQVAPYRPVEPLKSLLFRPREFLGAVTGEAAPAPLAERIVMGVKNCDLSALRVHDHVLLKSDPPDPLYAEARERTILVSADCADCLDVCFCSVVGEQPYPRAGFDINLSPVGGGCVIEAGSPRGEELLKAVSDHLRPAGEDVVRTRDEARAGVLRKVTEQAARKGLKPEMDFRKAIRASFEAKLWEDAARDCVECGACNFCCCTCHCFLLADGTAACGPARVKLWDSCLLKNFARVAGGANPRPHRAERLLNRFDKKFVFFPETIGSYACDGCGRCVEACTGKIDIRDVLQRAVHESG